jgi:hypothetical protein
VFLVVGTDLLVTVKAKWDTVLLIVGPTGGLINDVRGFDINAALFQAKAAPSIAPNEHPGVHSGDKRHLVSPF